MFMFTLILIFLFFYVIGSVLWVRRVLSASKSKPAQPAEFKACEFCGMMVRIDTAVKVNGRIFCNLDHAYQMR